MLEINYVTNIIFFGGTAKEIYYFDLSFMLPTKHSQGEGWNKTENIKNKNGKIHFLFIF